MYVGRPLSAALQVLVYECVQSDVSVDGSLSMQAS